MPVLNGTDSPIKLLDKGENVIGMADKVSFTMVKGKGEAFPKSATVVLYGVDSESRELDNFDILYDGDDGVVQKRVRIMNCRAQGWVDGKFIAVALAPDVTLQEVQE